MSDLDPTALERDLRSDTKGWVEGYVVRLYADKRSGLELQAAEEAILVEHGYLTQSSELAREGSLMVAYVRADVADEYSSLAYPGLGAATDPDSVVGRFGRPAAWVVAIGLLAFATWLLLTNLT
mgnify:CR=1 FL=1